MINNDLYSFMIVSEELNISKAAAKLYITQQSLSDKIKRLENKYGITLFERKPKLKLTPQGELMYQYAQTVISAEQKLLSDISYLTKHKTIKIGYSGTRGGKLLSLALKDLTNLIPNTSFSFISYNNTILESMLDSREIDAYVASVDGNTLASKWSLIYRTSFFYICRTDLLNRFIGSEIFYKMTYEQKLQAVFSIPFSGVPKNQPLRKSLDVFFKSHNILTPAEFESTSSSANFEICKNGIAGIILTTDLVEAYLASEKADGYVIVSLPDMVEFEPLSFVWKSEKKFNPQELLEVFKKTQDSMSHLVRNNTAGRSDCSGG